MSKPIFCAQCGAELTTFLKAIPNKARVITIIAPHVCNKKDIENLNWELNELSKKPTPAEEKKTKEMFDGFPFVQKINKGIPEREVVSLGDKRDKKHTREELITSSAPLSVLGGAKER